MKFKKIIAAGLLIGSFVFPSCTLNAEAAGKSAVTPISIRQAIEAEEALIQQQEAEVKDVYDYIYTTDRVNIRISANTESEILLTAAVGTKLQRTGQNVYPGWDSVSIGDTEYYISNEFITINEPERVAATIEQQIEDNKIPASDLRYMSAIIWAEAGNQCEAGQQAVGIVVMNRVASEIYEDTVYTVINEPYQFSPVLDGSFLKALNYYDSEEMPESIINAAKYALRGNTTITYNGQVYDLEGYLYFSRYISGCRLQIEEHMFK